MKSPLIVPLQTSGRSPIKWPSFLIEKGRERKKMCERFPSSEWRHDWGGLGWQTGSLVLRTSRQSSLELSHRPPWGGLQTQSCPDLPPAFACGGRYLSGLVHGRKPFFGRFLSGFVHGLYRDYPGSCSVLLLVNVWSLSWTLKFRKPLR